MNSANHPILKKIRSVLKTVLNEIGLLVTKLNELLIQLDDMLTKFQVAQKTK